MVGVPLTKLAQAERRFGRMSLPCMSTISTRAGLQWVVAESETCMRGSSAFAYGARVSVCV